MIVYFRVWPPYWWGHEKPSLSAPDMSVSFSCAGFDIGSIKTRHETSTELSNSSRDDTVPLEYPIRDPRRDTPISAGKKFSLKMIVLGPICDSEAHIGRFRHPTAMF